MDSRHQNTVGFTLVELLVVIAVIAILVMLMLPAVSSVRAAARRAQCTNNVVQLIVAVQNYEEAHEVYPPGTINPTGPIQNRPSGYHHSWLIQLLPYVEAKAAARRIDSSVGVYHKNNEAVRQLGMDSYHCPASSERADVGWSNYAAVHHDVEAPIDDDNHGVFYLNSRTRYEDVEDGLSQTLFLGEKLVEPGGADLGWVSGTRATLRNTGTPINETGVNAPGIWIPMKRRPDYYEYDSDDVEPGQEPTSEDAGDVEGADGAADTAGDSSAGGGPASLLYVGGFGSHHGAGANFAFGGGRVKFLSDEIDQQAFQQMGHRSDGQLIDAVHFGP